MKNLTFSQYLDELQNMKKDNQEIYVDRGQYVAVLYDKLRECPFCHRQVNPIIDNNSFIVGCNCIVHPHVVVSHGLIVNDEEWRYAITKAIDIWNGRERM